MTSATSTLFERLWQQYIQVTPSALKIHHLLGSNADIINDHVAFRTFNHPKINVEQLAKHFVALGYQECGQYQFSAKKLDAKHYEHHDSTLPRIFISELRIEKFNADIQSIIADLIEPLPDSIAESASVLYAGCPWPLNSKQYEKLLQVSEYAAWFAAWGFRANHFTVSVNHLDKFQDIKSINETLKTMAFH